MIINPYIYGVATSYDPDAQLFFNAQSGAGVSLTTTQMNAVNQWVVDSKAAGIWTKFKAIYPFVGGTATAHKFNLKNPADTNAAFRLAFSGGGTHSSNGYQPGGVNGYANTFLGTSAMALNSGHFSYYSRTTSTGTFTEMGALQNSPNSYSDFGIAYTGFGAYFRYNDGGANTAITNTDSKGFYIGTRTASNVIKFYKNATALWNGTNASNATSTFNILIGAVNSLGTPANYSNRECAFASIGDGLTDAEALAYYNAVQLFNTTLARQV